MRLATYTRHDDVGPDQIILRLAGDVAGVTVTLSNGRRDRLTLYSDPTPPGRGTGGAGLSTERPQGGSRRRAVEILIGACPADPDAAYDASVR